ncbi:MAG: cytochrome P450, partial [Pseudomonadota bacterium]
DYVAPSLDTTILASAQLLWSLASTPGAYDALRDTPDLSGSAVNEAVRLASPIRGFSRYAQTDYDTEDGSVPAGSRVLVLYASANWDERHFVEPDTFQVDRNPRDHVGWGHGVHTCAGMHLARAEMLALLKAMTRHVDRLDVSNAEPIMNNVLQGFASFDATFH